MTGTTEEDLREAREKWDQMTPDQKRKLMAESLLRVMEEYQEGHPRFMAEGLLRILTGAIVNLREYLTDGRDPDISWSSPFVELRYSVLWDWEEGRDTVRPITDEDLHNPADPIGSEWIAETFSRILDITILKGLTKGAAFLTKGEETVSLIAPEIQEALDAMTEEERDAYLTGYGEPFVVGGAYQKAWEFDEDQLKEGEPIEEDGEPVMALVPHGPGSIEDTKPVLPFKGEVDGVPFSGSVVFAVHPLVVDGNHREAFYPVVVGIQFDPTAEDVEKPEDLVFPDPTLWSPADRETFWTALMGGLEEIGDGLLPEFEPMETAPLSGVSKGISTATGTLSVTGMDAILSASGTVTDGTPTIPTTDTMEVFRALGATEVRIVAPPPSRTPRTLKDGRTHLSRETATMVRSVGGLSLPRKWSSVNKWDDLVEKEVSSIQNFHGADAFKLTESGPALLELKMDTKGKSVIRLTKEGERGLVEREGLRGFVRMEKDLDGRYRENLVKTFRSGSTHLTVHLSWYGGARPLVRDGPDAMEKELKELKAKAEQGVLFDDLTDQQREIIEGRFRNLEYIRHGRDLMEAIALKFGSDGENPVRYSAHDLKVLLECENDPEGMRRIQGCLRALQEVRYSLEVVGGNKPLRSFGPFLADVEYKGRGPGDHTDGDFLLSISPTFIGCLRVFAVKSYRVKDAEAALFLWSKDLSKEEKEVLRKEPFLQGFSRLSPYFDKAKGFTDPQKSLRQWVESEITRRSDRPRKGSSSPRVKKTAKDAREPRLYGPDFCPLIPEGKLLAGALGHFSQNPETGRTLGGTPTRSTKTGGGHTEGLLSVMGYFLPPGEARETRKRLVSYALQDIEKVVEAFAGVVAAQRPDGRWLTLEEAAALPEEELVKRVRWFIFVHPKPGEHMGRTVETYQKGRYERGETPHPIRVVRHEPDAPVDEAAPRVGLEGEPLHVRLYLTRKERKLSQAAVGAIFGVIQQAVAAWERGEETGKAIPAELAPMVLRWVEDGTPPTADELAARKTRRGGPPKTPST